MSPAAARPGVFADPSRVERDATDAERPPAGGGRPFADLDEEPSWDEQRVLDDRRSRRLVFTAIGVATAVTMAVLAVGQFGLSRSSGLLDRLAGTLVAGRGETPIAPTEYRADTPGVDPAATARGSGTAPPGGTPAAPVSPSRTTAAPAPPEGATESPVTLPPAPRSPGPAEGGSGAPARGTATAPATASSTSEERMAAFLVEELGPAPAAEKALANAAWYGAGESEHAYWQRVADAITRRPPR